MATVLHENFNCTTDASTSVNLLCKIVQAESELRAAGVTLQHVRRQLALCATYSFYFCFYSCLLIPELAGTLAAASRLAERRTMTGLPLLWATELVTDPNRNSSNGLRLRG